MQLRQLCLQQEPACTLDMMKSLAANARVSNGGLENVIAKEKRACVSAAVTCFQRIARKVDCNSAHHKLEHVVGGSVQTFIANTLHVERRGYLENIQQLGVARSSHAACVDLHPLLRYNFQGWTGVHIVTMQDRFEVKSVDLERGSACAQCDAS